MRWLFLSPVVLLLYAGICYYIGSRLLGFIRCFLPDTSLIMFWFPFSLVCCVLVLLNFLRNNFFLQRAGSYWTAVFLYLFMFLALSELIKLILFLFGKKPQNINLYTAGTAVLLCVVLIVYGALHARSIETADYNLTLNGSGGDIRIALISDLHIGSSIGKAHIEKVVDIVNQAKPNIVCIAGDIFDGNLDVILDLQGIISALKGIYAPSGVYACLGNHDVDRLFRGSTERIAEILQAADIVLLQDEVYTVRENLHIAGCRDARPIGMNAERKTPAELIAGLEGTIIVLDHQPVQFAQLEKAGADLTLCGHTHSGQLFPLNLITRRIFKKAGATHYGYWQGETMQAVVTSGAGFWGPQVRIGTNSEVAVININFTP